MSNPHTLQVWLRFVLSNVDCRNLLLILSNETRYEITTAASEAAPG